MAKVRVLIIDDSLTVRRRLADVLSADQDIEVLADAGDGRSGIELCERLRPDVVTLDMVLPGLSGVDVTEYIMAYCPTPILIVSSSVNRGELYETYDALAAGAVDVLDKRGGEEAADSEWEASLLAAVKLVARIKVITHPRLRLHGLGARSPRAPAGAATLPTAAAPADRHKGVPAIIAVGASTGGPRALLDIFTALPGSFPIPFLLVIHIGGPFGAAFAAWLNGQSPIPARFARDREPLPRPGRPQIVMAPPDRHLVVSHGLLRLTSEPERHSCRPSVDVLFESVARECGSTALGCLLTGMGADGAAGLLRLKQSGGRTIAQDESTSVVFGMPREAIMLGAAERVLRIKEVAPALLKLVSDAAPDARSLP